MAKIFASNTGMSVTTEAVQIFGGNSYSREYPVELCDLVSEGVGVKNSRPFCLECHDIL